MYYRCVNDILGYCSGEPELDVEANQVDGYFHGAHCRHDPKTCGKYQTSLESLRRQVDETKDRLDDWTAFNSVKNLVATLEKKEKELEIS